MLSKLLCSAQTRYFAKKTKIDPKHRRKLISKLVEVHPLSLRKTDSLQNGWSECLEIGAFWAFSIGHTQYFKASLFCENR